MKTGFIRTNEFKMIHGNLPLGLKKEYNNKQIHKILELEEEFMSKNSLFGKLNIYEDKNFRIDELIWFIIENLNEKGIFPTYSDVKKVLDIKLSHLQNTEVMQKLQHAA